jgi:cytochrome P450
MALHPEVQAAAHAELDALTRRARLPAPADAPALPYVRALVSEVLRWLPVTPMGASRRAAREVREC